jgi:hypothetical protein
MHYRGTIIDLVLAIIMMTRWYRSAGRDLARTARRPAARPVPSGSYRSWSRAVFSRTPFDARPAR